jgi:alpha-beta hydrolase superfamily lysophospholipase
MEPPARKKIYFRFGEALAAAGFECYSVDQAGHGESPQRYSFTNIPVKFRELERHLEGWTSLSAIRWAAGGGAWSVREDGFRPKLYIGVDAGALRGPRRGPPAPPFW